MSSDPNKRQVHIFDAKTGKARLSQPVPVQTSRAAAPEPPAADALNTATTPVPMSEDDAAAVQRVASTSGSEMAKFVASVTVTSETTGPDSAVPTENGSADQAPALKGGASGKPKADIQTLEQFIAYAYGRKGQRIVLKSKTERLIAQNPRLDDGALSRLHALAKGDTLLTVPRQLLLVSREIQGLPGLRAALTSFVSDVMLRHPVFADADVQAAMRNLPEAPSAAVALTMVAGYTRVPIEGQEPLKGADLQALRRNATHLLATWMTNSRSFNFEELVGLLFQTLWAPAARDLGDDNARLRALTEVEQLAGVGLACQRFKQQAVDAHAAQDQSHREAATLRARVAELDGQCQKAEAELVVAVAELQALRQSSEAELTELRREHEVERVHQRHESEQLRGRLLRRLGDSIEMLEVGLTALRNRTPRIEVMAERAEHVIDALRAEATNLKEE